MIDTQNAEQFVKFSLYALCAFAMLCFFINLKWRLPKRLFSLLAIVIIVQICWFTFEYSTPKNNVPASQNQVSATTRRELVPATQTISATPLVVSIIRPTQQVAGTLNYSLQCVPSKIERAILLGLKAEILDDDGNAKRFDSLIIHENAITFVFSFEPPAFIEKFKSLKIFSPAGTLNFEGKITETIIGNSLNDN